MSTSMYRLPAELARRLHVTRTDRDEPPANGFTHDGKLNMGPAILFAAILSGVCWAVLIGLGIKLFH